MRRVEVQDGKVPETFREIRKLVDDGERRLALDCAAWSYFGSADLGALLALRKQLLPLDGEIVIVAPSARLRKFIDMLGLGQAFEIFEDFEQAEAYLKHP